MGVFLRTNLLCCTAIPKFKRLNGMKFSACCTILMTFGPVMPEFMLLTITLFVAIQQKSAYHAKYLRISPVLTLTYFTVLVVVLVGMIIPVFVWQSPKGRCYGNQLYSEDVCRRPQERPLLFALAFDNGFANREATFKRLSFIPVLCLLL